MEQKHIGIVEKIIREHPRDDFWSDERNEELFEDITYMLEKYSKYRLVLVDETDVNDIINGMMCWKNHEEFHEVYLGNDMKPELRKRIEQVHKKFNETMKTF